jgi:hypothetical protein
MPRARLLPSRNPLHPISRRGHVRVLLEEHRRMGMRNPRGERLSIDREPEEARPSGVQEARRHLVKDRMNHSASLTFDKNEEAERGSVYLDREDFVDPEQWDNLVELLKRLPREESDDPCDDIPPFV